MSQSEYTTNDAWVSELPYPIDIIAAYSRFHSADDTKNAIEDFKNVCASHGFDWAEICVKLDIHPRGQPFSQGRAEGPESGKFSRFDPERVKEIVQNSKIKAAQQMREIIGPIEDKFVADMKELSAKSDLGYQKATAAYLAGEGDSDYERHMKGWYEQMKAILSDKTNPQAAADLRATLQEEYTTVMMSDWDKAQIAKLLGKK